MMGLRESQVLSMTEKERFELKCVNTIGISATTRHLGIL